MTSDKTEISCKLPFSDASRGGLSRRAFVGACVATAWSLASHPAAAHPAPSPQVVDNLVIGSGYGGSVAACRLTEAGHNVTLLEMGGDWGTPGNPSTFTTLLKPDWRSMWHRRRTALPMKTFLWMNVIDKDIESGPGVLDRVDFAEMSVYRGVGVGGGSLVNGGMAVRPPRDYLQERLPLLQSEEFYSTYLPRAEAALGVNRIRPEFLEKTPYYQFARTARETAKDAGYRVVDVPNVYDFAHMEEEEKGAAPASALNHEVIFGNNHGKRDLRSSYLARARATGRLSVRSSCKAVQLLQHPNGTYQVEIQELGRDGKPTAHTTLTARRVFLGAGTVGTNELLLRSIANNSLPGVRADVGAGFGPNGNVMAARAGHLWHRTGAKQSTIPVLGIDHWTGQAQPNRVFAEIAPMPAKMETYLSLYLGIADNPVRGRFRWTTSGLALDWRRHDSVPAVEAMRRMLDRVNAQAGTVYRSDLFGNGKIFTDDFTYHPLGGCVYGQATELNGQVKGLPGLYVVDGSLLPGCVGVNPFLGITALAELVMDRVMEDPRLL